MTSRIQTDTAVRPFTLEDLAEAYYAREDMLLEAERCAGALDLPPRPGEIDDDPDFVPDADDDNEDGDAGAPPEDAPDEPQRPNSDNEENLPPHSPEDDANREPLR